MTYEKKAGSVVIYARSDVQDPGAIMQQYAAAQRSAEVELGEPATVTYCDDGMAGSTMRRPALQTLLQHVDAGFVRAIIVASHDRLTRSYMDDLRLRVRFQAAGIPLIVAARIEPAATKSGSETAIESDGTASRHAPTSSWFVRALSALRISTP
ncbi:recombinase family protein [Lysobacter sp. Hz 25]|uniref:recombinase family protein n=1 Tax=Lysobacter sp. Hz 25 TaxID=3383698 RepID=UPI0038D50438